MSHFITLHFTVLHQECILYKLKARPSSSKKRLWLVISLRYAYVVLVSCSLKSWGWWVEGTYQHSWSHSSGPCSSHLCSYNGLLFISSFQSLPQTSNWRNWPQGGGCAFWYEGLEEKVVKMGQKNLSYPALTSASRLEDLSCLELRNPLQVLVTWVEQRRFEIAETVGL